MTEQKIPCEAVSDLLPLYIDNLTSKPTASLIRAHLMSCPACAEKYDKMTAPIPKNDTFETPEQEPKEIDYLKKVQKQPKKLLTGFCTALALVLLCVGVKLYIIGWESDSATFGISTSEDAIPSIIVSGSVSENYAYKGYKIKTLDDGTEKLVFRQCKSSPLFRDRTFTICIPYESIKTELNISGSIYKPDGTGISNIAFSLYKHKNPYIGDMSANADLAMILGIYEHLGSFENKLITDKKPFVWQLYFKNLPPGGYGEKTFNDYMTAASCVFLAEIENADKITWSYPVTPEKNKRKTQTVTCEDASAILGQNVKSFAKSPERIDEMLNILQAHMSNVQFYYYSI